MPKVIVYGKTVCDLCDNTAFDLKQAGFDVTFVKVDLEKLDPKIKKKFSEINLKEPQFPAIESKKHFRVVKSDLEIPTIIILLEKEKSRP